MVNSASGTPHEVLRQARSLAKARDWAELAQLATCEAVEETGGVPELGYLVADALRRTGRTGEAGALAERAASGAVRLGDRHLVLRTLNLSGMLAFESGDLSAAENFFHRLLEKASELSDDEFVARASNNLGVLANVRGEREVALTAYQRALPAYYRLGHARGLAQTYYNLGISYRDLGYPDDAERHYASAIRYAAVSQSDDVAALADTERAYLLALKGDGAMAESLAELALRRLEAMQDPGGCANAIRVLAIAAEARGLFTLALARQAEALSITDVHQDLLLHAEILRDRGRVLKAVGDTEAASAALSEAREAFAQLGAAADEAATNALLNELGSESPPGQI